MLKSPSKAQHKRRNTTIKATVYFKRLHLIRIGRRAAFIHSSLGRVRVFNPFALILDRTEITKYALKKQYCFLILKNLKTILYKTTSWGGVMIFYNLNVNLARPCII
jgi:hypothetical protein